MTSFTIPGELIDLNQYIRNERGNLYAAASIKKNMTEICTLCAKKVRPVGEKVKLLFTWYCCNEKKDPDNISFAKKFIIDGMVKAGVLKNDGWKQIGGFEDNFIVDKHNPRVEVEIRAVSSCK
jgi:Holliday junction resolvase RusA-like endonuclease